MPVQRKTVSFGQQIAIDRQYDPYIYGGNWDPFNRKTGTDCSGCVVDATAKKTPTGRAGATSTK